MNIDILDAKTLGDDLDFDMFKRLFVRIKSGKKK